MRITIATGPCFPVPPLRGGGMIRMWMALGEAFAQAGHAVTLLARTHPGQPARSTLAGMDILRWGGYDQPRSTALSLAKDLRYAWGACTPLPAADILVTNDFWLPVFAPHRRPDAGAVIVSVNRRPKHQLGLYHRAARLVVPTGALRAEVRRQSPSWEARTACIPNCFDGRIFQEDAAAAQRASGILYVGRLHREKGVDLLLRAFRRTAAQAPHARLTVVGPHEIPEGGSGPDYRAELEALARGLPVDFRGPVHEPDALASLYRSHALFCYPSLADRGEAMGIAPLEAMACGCVPVVSANPVFNDWLKPGVNGRSFDHHAPGPDRLLADCLLQCLGDSRSLVEMRGHALAAAARYEARVVAREFLGLFAEVLR